MRQIATNCEFSILEDYKEAPLSRSLQHTHKSSRKPEQSLMNNEAEGIIWVTASFFSALDLKKTLKILILFKEEGASKFGRICFFLSTSFFIIIILNATMPSKNNLK